MKKSLTLIALAALIMVASAPLFAADNINFGADLEFRGISLFRENAADDHYAQSEIYLWATADLADNVMAKINFKYRQNFGNSGVPSFTEQDSGGNVDLVEGFVKLSKIWDSPVSLMIGRWVPEKANEAGPNISNNNSRAAKVPFYGEGFVIPNNGPADGARLTLDLDQSWIDFLWYKVVEGAVNANSDISVYGIYGQTKLVENHTFDAYVLYLDNQAYPTGTSQTGVMGIRANGQITPVAGLGYKAEFAYTHTHIQGPGDEPDGFGGYAGVDYTFADVQYGPSVRLNGYFLEHNFTQLYGHVDQDDVGEVGYGRILDAGSNLNTVTNGNGAAGANGVYFFNLGATVKPADRWAVDADYYKYNNSWGNSHLGHEVDLRLSYQYSENVAAELIGAYFIAPTNRSGLRSATLLGVPDDAYLLKGGIKVSF